MGQAQHGLTRLQHLAGLGLNGGDHAIGIGAQLRVIFLIALAAGLGQRLRQLRLRRLQAGAAAIQLGTTDEVLRLQLGKAFIVRLGQIALRGGCCHLGLCRLHGQAVVACIQLRQQLPGAHRLAQLHMALHQLASHTKAQARLHTRTHIGSEQALGLHLAGAHRQQLDGPHGLGWRLWARAARQGGTQRQSA